VTLGMAFSGQVLRFDQDAYWGLGIGASIASHVPVIGPAAVKLMLGGPIIAGATLSRFFALHVFVIPGTLIALVGVHLLMVLKLGINEWPMPGRLVNRATYTSEYHELTKQDGAPFVPYAIWEDLFFAGFILLAVAACAVYFGPFGRRICLGSSRQVLKAAEDVVKHIVENYRKPNLTAEQIESVAVSDEDPLRNFSDICRIELESMQRQI
jgi:quinol-cytochrome oxidoreductase complex cytochrome b subunit